MENMKPSGIEWIGDIPKDWEVSRLKYATNIIMGQSPDSEQILDEPAKYYFMQGNAEFTDLYPVPSAYCEKPNKKSRINDILMSVRAPVGAMNISDRVYGIGRGLCSIQPVKFQQKYLWYYMLKSKEDLLYYSNGSTFEAITTENLLTFSIVIPPLSEQTLIANFLDKQCGKIDNIIADIEKQIEILGQYKKSLITESVTKGLDKNAPMKDSGIEWIGDIPEHWEVRRLKFMLENCSENMKVGPFGSALTSGDYVDEGVWVYNQRTVLDNNFLDNETYISEDKYKELKGFSVYTGDILITTRGTTGKVAIVPSSAKKGILHPCIIKFRINEDLIKSELIKLIFNESDFAKEQFAIMSNSTTIDVIYSYSLKDIILPVIPQKEQDYIYSFLEEHCSKIDSIINSKKEQLNKINEHKKSLIYEYVIGKKRVKGAVANGN